MGEKAQYNQKGRKTLKIEIFHSHPCGFYIKNRPFAIEMAVWGLGLLLCEPQQLMWKYRSSGPMDLGPGAQDPGTWAHGWAGLMDPRLSILPKQLQEGTPRQEAKCLIQTSWPASSQDSNQQSY